MNKNIITISGKPGCGKSTVAKILSSELGYRVMSSGERFREIAKSHGMDIVDFVANYLPNHDEIDLEVDQYFVDYVKSNDDLIIPTRVVGHLLKRNGVNPFNVYLYADEDIRIDRIILREGGSDSISVKSDLDSREKFENLKYSRIYNIDINDLSVYNLVIYTHFLPSKLGFIEIMFNGKTEYIETDNTLPETISGIIIEKYKEFKNLNFKQN